MADRQKQNEPDVLQSLRQLRGRLLHRTSTLWTGFLVIVLFAMFYLEHDRPADIVMIAALVLMGVHRAQMCHEPLGNGYRLGSRGICQLRDGRLRRVVPYSDIARVEALGTWRRGTLLVTLDSGETMRLSDAHDLDSLRALARGERALRGVPG